MKTKLLLMLLTIALVAGVAQANMLKNPGFEEGSFQTQFSPDNWENYYTTYGQVHTWINNTAEAHSGSKYIRMYNWFVRAPSYTTIAYLGQEVVGVKEGKDYTFSVWAKNDVEGQVNLARIHVDWLDSAGTWLIIDGATVSDFVDIAVTDANWVEIDFGAFTAPKGTGGAWVWLATPLGNRTKPIFYDDVSMLGADPNITAGTDMISWDGETLSLTGTTTLDGYSTITWSAEPDYGAVITDGNTLTPTVDVDCIIPSGPATIANHSFENGLDNWEILAGEGHDTWNGVDEPNDLLTVFITPTDGRQCAYMYGGDGVGKLSQVLANTLAANTDYTLSVDVVNDGYYEENVEYRVQLYAGGSLLAQDNDGQALDTYGEWKTSTVNFSTGDDHAALGEQLEIRLVAKAGTAEMNFDNVRLTANPEFPAHVPDVLALKFTLDIDGKYDTMKIDTYPDACAAWLAAGLRETTDLVGDDCITNLADLAEIVKTWTDDNALTEPKAKEQDPGPEPGMGEIAIVNASFEDPVRADGQQGAIPVHWTVPESRAQIWNPGDGTGNYNGHGGIAPDGENVLWINGIGACSQVLADTLTANIDYTLTVEVAVNQYYENNPSYKVELLAGETVLAEDDNSIPLMGDGLWELSTVTFDSTGVDPALLGEPLQIRLGCNIPLNVVTDEGETNFDDVRLYFKDKINPSPADGSYVYSANASDLELSWTNLDPNKPGDPVYVDVWFGTDPNKLPPPSPTYDFNKIVDAVEDANSVTVDASTLDTYYWQVNSYIYGSATGDPIEGAMYRFHVVTDTPVSVEVGDDMITWSGQAVQLAGSVDDDGVSAVTLGWSADPAAGVVFDPNEFVEDPTVTITKVTDNPSVVTLTFLAQDAVSSDEDTMTIDVYDNSCLAAIGEGQEYDPGDFDVDCDTDLEDYAALAEEWLVYKELATSIVKP